MAQLRRKADLFEQFDIEIIVVGPEEHEDFARYWDKQEMPFIGIPDPDHSIAKLYGQEVRILKLGRMPAQFLIDTSGTLLLAHYGKSMADIPGINTVIETLNR